MTTRRSQRGDVPVGCVIGMVVLFLVIIIGIKVTPVMVRVGEFEREVAALADRGNRYDYTDPRIEKMILEKAEELDLAVTDKQIDIKRTRSRIKVKVVYDVAIEFPGYTYVWHRDVSEDRPLF